MKRFVVGLMAAGVLVSVAQTAMAQAKTVYSEMRTETGVVEAVEASTRTVTLKKPDGTFVSTVAGPDIKRFSEIKVGDKITARYYDNVVVRLKRPGEPEGFRIAGHDAVRPDAAGWYESQADKHHGNNYGHQSRGAVGDLHRAERLEVHL